MSRPVAVVVGYVVRYPVGGMTWVFLHHLLGLRDLGFDVVFMEAAGPQPTCYDVAQGRMTEDPTYGVTYLEAALRDAGLDDCRWWYADPDLPGGGLGMSYDEAVAVLEDAAVLVNVSGSCWAPEFSRATRRVLVDTDAPFTQIRLADGDEGWRAFVDAHDAWATYAVGVAGGTDRVDVPRDRPWVATRPPVHLPAWTASAPPQSGAWSTVTSWTSYGGSWWRLEEWRQKDVEYMRLRDLPRLVPDLRVELALGGSAPRRQLEEFGWRIVDPVAATLTPQAFTAYVASARGELGVAKQAYVRGRTGAFNDRSLCYLASGRPVVCSDTGLADWLPVGEGLLVFDDAAGAAAALREVESDPVRHGLAGRSIAEKHFSAVDVARQLLQDVGVGLP